jgi:sporulation protein YlmC with PRC-barrel domain
MRKYLLCGAALAILGLAAAPLIAQTQTTTSSSGSGYVQTSKIIGTKVKTAQGEEVGVVKDVVLDRSNGCMAYTVLSTGGTGRRVTGQAKLVAVPWSVYSVSPDTTYLTVTVERDRIYNTPVFEDTRISDTTYTTNVFSHFGVSASWRLRHNNHYHRREHADWRNSSNSSGHLCFTSRIGRGQRLPLHDCFSERAANRERVGNCDCKRNRVAQSNSHEKHKEIGQCEIFC